MKNKVKSGKNTGSGNGTRISMDQVLKDMGTVQLRKIARYQLIVLRLTSFNSNYNFSSHSGALYWCMYI